MAKFTQQQIDMMVYKAMVLKIILEGEGYSKEEARELALGMLEFIVQEQINEKSE